MNLPFCIFTILLLLAPASCQPCQQLSQYAPEIICEDLGLLDFPNFKGFTASSYKLSGNSFSQLTNSTFPHGLAKEIHITNNEIPLSVTNDALQHLSSSLAMLRLRNVDFQFDQVFEPVIGLRSLNSLQLGNMRYSRNLTVRFLDEKIMNQLIRLEVVHSGVDFVGPKAMESEFRRLRYLSLSYNRLRFIPEGLRGVLGLSPRHVLHIDLSHNLMDTVLPQWFPAHCTITSLDLGYNNIRSVRLRALDNCVSLTKLVLEGNPELLYLSPTLFPNNCHMGARLDVHVPHSGIRNVEFALRSCVNRVYYWNTSVPCTCRHMSLVQCTRPLSRELYGECLWDDSRPRLLTEARELWKKEGCHLPGTDSLYSPSPMPSAGDPLASLKDWGSCPMETTTTSTTTTTTTTAATTTSLTTATPTLSPTTAPAPVLDLPPPSSTPTPTQSPTFDSGKEEIPVEAEQPAIEAKPKPSASKAVRKGSKSRTSAKPSVLETVFLGGSLNSSPIPVVGSQINASDVVEWPIPANVDASNPGSRLHQASFVLTTCGLVAALGLAPAAQDLLVKL